MTTTTSPGAVKRATYTVDSRARVLFTIRDDGFSKLIDVPAEMYGAVASGLDTPDTYVVEPQLPISDTSELKALVADYLDQAAERDRVPMTFSRLGDYLEKRLP